MGLVLATISVCCVNYKPRSRCTFVCFSVHLATSSSLAARYPSPLNRFIMSATPAPIEHEVPRHHWVSPAEERSENEVNNKLISAYNKGKKKGWDEVFETLEKLTIQNLQHAQGVVEELFAKFEDVHKLSPFVTFLAMEKTPSHFKAITVISEEEIVSDKALSAIRQAKQLLEGECTDFFHMEHMFTYQSEHLDDSRLEADGYYLRYEPEA